VKLVPVAIGVPPEIAAYHETVPVLDIAPNVTVPDPQRTAGVVPVIVGVGFTITD
jgi:hypothetical protein